MPAKTQQARFNVPSGTGKGNLAYGPHAAVFFVLLVATGPGLELGGALLPGAAKEFF